jgi:hypothetical protein
MAVVVVEALTRSSQRRQTTPETRFRVVSTFREAPVGSASERMPTTTSCLETMCGPWPQSGRFE